MKNRGFTLLELLIVVSIIGILAAMALPRFQQANNQARCGVERGTKRTVDTQIELYSITTGFFPSQASVATSMTELLNSTTYFPDGKPKDPFTKATALGTYTMDTTGAPAKMRVIGHLVAHGVDCNSF